MKVDLEAGKYVIAVSGGVDSVALLHALTKFQIPNSKFQFVVAHLDHGIRPDSADDAVFVMKLAEKYGLPFVGGSVRLGASASEEEARKHRYNFLKLVAKNFGAEVIITAHHQDDVIETALINILRGTGRKGLSSLRSSKNIRRPLLGVSKQQIVKYAKANKLSWREDSTNQDERYLRNRIRQSLAQNMDAQTRHKTLQLLQKMQQLNLALDEAGAELLLKYSAANTMQRQWFVSLPHTLSLEILAYWLRAREQTFDKKSLNRLANFIKTGRPGAKVDVSGGSYILIDKHQISLIGPK